MLELIFISSCSAAFEWQGQTPYYTEGEYTVFLNGEKLFSKNTNVFSVFNLLPDTEYTLTTDISDEEITFNTKPESVAISLSDFGAVGDGVTDDSVAIQMAINCLPAQGRLIFDEGIYLTAPIVLKSHITLEIKRGAVILGHPDKSKYPLVPGVVRDRVNGEDVYFGTWEGNAVPMHASLIFAEYAEDVTIVGEGIVDGNAEAAGWWIDVKNYMVARPRLMFFNRCTGVRVHGIHARNSASWQMHPYFSKNIDFIDMYISAPKDSPNTDAIDPEACDVVNIIGCRFSVGDDCIAIKSGKIDIGRKLKTPASRHTIRNCHMQFGHGAVTLGSEMAGGVKSLTVNRCVFRETDRGLRIKTRRGRGKDAIIDGVLFENIKMEGVITPIVINMFYNCCDPDRHSEYVWSREKLPIDDRTPYLGEFTFRNMECLDCEAAACYLDGLPEMPIGSVVLESLRFTYKENAKPSKPAMREFMEDFLKVGIYVDNVRTLRIKDVSVEGANTEALVLSNVGTVIKE